MTAYLPAALLDRLALAAEMAAPNEACALLLGRMSGDVIHIEDIALSANLTAGNPETSFEIDPKLHLDLQRAARGGGATIIGVWHSHPNGVAVPSATDKAQSMMPGWLWLITVPWGATAAFTAGADNPHDLLPVTLVSN